MTQTTSDEDFAARVTELNDMAKRCADETVYRAELTGEDRNTVLRAVITRLQDAINAKLCSGKLWKWHPAMKAEAIKALIEDFLGDNCGSLGRDVEAAGTLTNLRNQVVYLQMTIRAAVEDIEDQDVGSACRRLRISLDRTNHE